MLTPYQDIGSNSNGACKILLCDDPHAGYNKIKDELSQKCVKLEKANKASEWIADAALAVPDKSPRFVNSIEACSALQERAIKLEGELNFALKFKKTLDGKKVTEEVGNSLMADATIVIAEMYEEAKIIKSLTACDKKKNAE